MTSSRVFCTGPSEGLVLNLTRGTSPGDGYGSGGSGSRGSGSGPGSASGYDFGSPDESAALTTMAHLSLASSATRELVRRTGAGELLLISVITATRLTSCFVHSGSRRRVAPRE
jgi:hypothetical protein